MRLFGLKARWLVRVAVWLSAVTAGIALSSGVFADMFMDTTTQTAPQEFSHMQTGFPLTGMHQVTECASCHVGGIFKGTPRNCVGCHTKGQRVTATAMPNNHVPTSDPCDKCHTNTVTFQGARFDHSRVAVGGCASCHNGIVATGRPANHNSGLRLGQACDRCHRTFSWVVNGFNHTGVMPRSCATQCHNGQLATGRPGSHTTVLKSTSSCDLCHRFTAWYPTFYDHSGVASGSCANCHNGTEATNRPSGHSGMKATLACDQCHNTYAWLPATYNHVGVAAGSCANCHNGSSATGKPSSHTGAKATMTCDQCHGTAAWLPAAYNHSGVARGTCLNCHVPDRPSAHAARGYTASCDNCHTTATWTFNHALQQGQHTCNACHAYHHNDTPCDYCHSVNSWGR